ncbi:MAG: tRNA preQ1(34) S-adenosylmethionine ribosyltransferase-isomerase QueA [Butyrivibrio sp.]|nr:tRNA preQ1(34) S-adenosylmethionine ribosyltransferase-isomerase QueA [Butyrivibrio sp.]
MTTGFSTTDYSYELPPELIAQDPLAERASSRLMTRDRRTGAAAHHVFHELPQLLRPGDLLVMNDTRVIPARLLGMKSDTGAAVEVLLLRQRGERLWECLVRPGKKLKPGASVTFGDGRLTGEVTEVIEEGNRLIRFSYDGIWEEVLDALGEMPLPPYITHKLAREDRERYQTVYARHEGSAAAPTAGLHFTPELLQELEQNGISHVFVTLHVGLGTFRPVKVSDVRQHHMHTEWYEVTAQTAEAVNQARAEGRRVICVGTTSCRTLESAAQRAMPLMPCAGETDIFIYPGYEFRVMDGLITNYHLPESTLLMLVSAFAGREHVLAAYEEAVRERYRFFSFGDAMLIS